MFPKFDIELKWWQENLSSMYNKINEGPPRVTVFSDTSELIFKAGIQGETGHLKKDLIT